MPIRFECRSLVCRMVKVLLPSVAAAEGHGAGCRGTGQRLPARDRAPQRGDEVLVLARIDRVHAVSISRSWGCARVKRLRPQSVKIRRRQLLPGGGAVTCSIT